MLFIHLQVSRDEHLPIVPSLVSASGALCGRGSQSAKGGEEGFLLEPSKASGESLGNLMSLN